LNDRLAGAYSWLGEIKAVLDAGDAMDLVGRAIAHEPREARHRLRAAFVLAHQKKLEEADVQARTALALADSDEERNRAQELLDRIAKAKGGESHES
jgi:hypothetical protein